MRFNWRELYAAYINLDHRTDRRTHMQEELRRVGLRAERFAAFKTKGSEWNKYPYTKMFQRTPGAIGCYLSQMAVMKAALLKGKGVTVFEDDLILASDIQQRLDYIENFVNTKAPDADVIFLGGTVHINPGHWHTNGHYPDIRGYCKCELNRDAERIDDDRMIRVYGMFSTHSYIIPYEKIPKILSLLESVMEQSYGIDFSFIMLQPQLKCYAFVPGSVSQLDNQSDIGNGMTIFSGFKMLGAHWFQDRMGDFNPSTYQWGDAHYRGAPYEIRYREQLVHLLRRMNLPMRVAEVGVAEGLFSHVLMMMGVNKLYAVDLWQQQPGVIGDGGSSQRWHDHNFQHAQRILSEWNGSIQFVQGYSTEAAAFVPDDELGMAYIDCNHSKESVTADIHAYLPKVVRGGVMAFHDYLNPSYGVKQAVDEFCRQSGRLVHLIPDIDNHHAGAWFIK